ncbi:MAG: phenylalanine--tRNA ligase subunit alpha [Candidatus Magasanikbacteria bacterium]|nr:phenylalanine--tRNA ligase subunit alpha [Candidatus Magasanikbacteria bacterium]
MREQLSKLKEEVLSALAGVKNLARLEDWENKILGRKNGRLPGLLKGLKDLSAEEKKAIGPLANQIKEELESAFLEKKKKLKQEGWWKEEEKERVDITQPSLPRPEIGHWHPVTLTQKELEELFLSMGFTILDGPELESEYYNFEALNFSPAHPARDMYDTFYIKGHPHWLMRTHTSPVQVRALQKYGAPLRAVVPGRCFRNEATDAAHEHTFYQLEGLVVDREISIAHLIAVMKELLKGVLQREVEVRLRPGYFPFVEPGFELDIKCLVCQGKGCGACKHSGWIETLPCGLVHPRVLEYSGLNSKEWTGFAFGLGLTRLVMQKYGIEDIRLLMGGEARFWRQF